MPEKPEVITVAKTLERKIINKTWNRNKKVATKITKPTKCENMSLKIYIL